MNAILETDQDIELILRGLIQATDEDDLLEVDPEFQKFNPFKEGVLKKYSEEEAEKILNIEDEEDDDLEDIDFEDDEDFDDEEFEDDEEFDDEDLSDFDDEDEDEDYSDFEEEEEEEEDDEDSKAFVPRHHQCTHC